MTRKVSQPLKIKEITHTEIGVYMFVQVEVPIASSLSISLKQLFELSDELYATLNTTETIYVETSSATFYVFVK